MPKRTIRDLDLANKRVLVRVDFNVPVIDGTIRDDSRIRASLATIEFVRDRGGIVILASHLGRPKGQRKSEFSLKPVATRLENLLNCPVGFASDCIGEAAQNLIRDAKPGDIILLENLRFHQGEENNDPEFAAQLGSLADVYVNDAFGAAHRAHASTVGVASHVSEKGAGFLMDSELKHLGALLSSPEHPFVALLGGSKVSGKLELITNLLDCIDVLLLGGAMAYTFFRARGYPTGKSLVEPELVDATRRLEKEAKRCGVRLELPVDHVVANRLEAGITCETIDVTDSSIGDRLGLDIGPLTINAYAEIIRSARTVVWNGPMGVFEIEEFTNGTVALAHAVANCPAKTLIGGGDSIAAVAKAGVTDRITHVSTGGGASLEFLGGRTLPGVSALPDG